MTQQLPPIFPEMCMQASMLVHRYLGLPGKSVSNPAIVPFPDQLDTAAIALGVAGATALNLTFGYSIIRTDPAGKPSSGC